MAPRTKSRRISKRSGRRPRREYFSPVSEKRGYQFILLDARASTSIRLESLEKLAELERKTAGYLSVRFLSRIIRDSTTPGKLRLAAVALLELCKAANQAKSFVRRRQKSQIQPTPMGADPRAGQTCTDSVQKEQ
jgi:hypothetical protein